MVDQVKISLAVVPHLSDLILTTSSSHVPDSLCCHCTSRGCGRPEPHPMLWAKTIRRTFQRFDHERKFTVRGSIAFDTDNKRVRELEDVYANQTKVSYLKVKLYNENKEYRVDLATKKCNVTAPRHPFHTYTVPSNGVYKDQFVLGAAGIPGQSVVLGIFDAVRQTDNITIQVLVTEPSCFPVEYAAFDSLGVDLTTFYDIKSGVQDPHAFDVPQECQSLW